MNLRVDVSARLVGTIRFGQDCYVAQGSVLRSRADSLKFGNASWVLENSVIVGSPEHPVQIGSKTVFGHKSICCGATIGDLCEIGNGTIFLPGAKIGNMCIFGEGTIIPAGTVIPDESVVVGRPGKVIRRLTDQDRAMLARMRGNDLSLGAVTETVITQETKERENMGVLYNFGTKYPVVADSAIIFDSAEITGDVTIGENSLIASGVRIIGNSHGPVKIGANVQILENTVLHLLPDNELIIGDHVTIGPGCIIHGTTVGANTIIEAGAIVCDYSVLGANTLIKSGSLVKQRSVIADNHIVEGFPARTVGINAAAQQRPT